MDKFKSKMGKVVRNHSGGFGDQPKAACCMPGIEAADVTSTTVYTPERRVAGVSVGRLGASQGR